MVGILAEKPSQARNFAAALGGMQGTYNGEQYVIVPARGHLYEFQTPDMQVPAYKQWSLAKLPWDEELFNWKRMMKSDAKDAINNIKSVLSGCDEICIGTDLDPTGEGDLLAIEILDELKFTPQKFTRMHFTDESAKEVQKAQKAIEAGTCPAEALEELKPVMTKIRETYPAVDKTNVGVGSTIFAVKPGDGSAREQAASCQKVLGGWANIANEYATKRYRSNLINWGMLPFITEEDHNGLSFQNGDYIFVPDVRKAVEDKLDVVKAFVVGEELKEITLKLGDLTDNEREIILKGCLINYYRG